MRSGSSSLIWSSRTQVRAGWDGRSSTIAVTSTGAILYVAATGCQWRALPECYPKPNTVHRYHLAWSRDGTWEAIVDRLRALVRQAEGHGPKVLCGHRRCSQRDRCFHRWELYQGL